MIQHTRSNCSNNNMVLIINTALFEEQLSSHRLEKKYLRVLYAHHEISAPYQNRRKELCSRPRSKDTPSTVLRRQDRRFDGVATTSTGSERDFTQ